LKETEILPPTIKMVFKIETYNPLKVFYAQ